MPSPRTGTETPFLWLINIRQDTALLPTSVDLGRGRVVLIAVLEEGKKEGVQCWNPGLHVIPSRGDIWSDCSLLCLFLF